uniref:RNase III domain-containing protein n=1 Tax=Nelumbo nucifera TaxID=4432 RepID=A0A822ZP75_NELNU|nr:TPA_asm: hypothetical protein HUJ06_001818 [Nelumbo nucifera]
MCSKTISDCVEALIGAYFIGGGLTATLSLMKWLGMDVEFNPILIDDLIRNASLWSSMPKVNELETLETKLCYSFSAKSLCTPLRPIVEHI